MADIEELSGSEVEDSDDEEVKESVEVGKRLPYNNQELMKTRLEQLKSDLKWIERMDITVNTKELPGIDKEEDKTNKNPEEDDFERELLFYRQAQVAAKEALSKLRDLSVPTERPEDYFAEMVKSDTHMQKIRQKMLNKKESIEKSEKAKKQRTLKKYGKKIQQQVLQKRQQEKKKMLQAVDHLKKNKGKLEKFSGKNDDELFNVSANNDKRSGPGGQKRKRKDEKFGFGGKKRKLKKNSADSSADAISSYKKNVHGNKASNGKFGKSGGPKGGGGVKGGGAKGKPKRLGKSRRMKGKGK